MLLWVGSLLGQQPEHSRATFVAHRGGIVEGVPENTLAAFRNAIRLGVDAIEIDLRGTRDGRIVVLHDETLDRTTTGHGPVGERTLGEIRALDAGAGERVPTYEEVLRLVSETRVDLLLDIKEGPAIDLEKVVDLTLQYGAASRVIVGVRSLEDLRTIRRLHDGLRTLGFVPTVDDVPAFATGGVDIIRLWPDWIRADGALVGRVHELGLPVWSTAGPASLEELRELIRAGVDGVLSDRPELMRRWVSGPGV
jgi:glycerophosphoryl diester phosphodiesterase